MHKLMDAIARFHETDPIAYYAALAGGVVLCVIAANVCLHFILKHLEKQFGTRHASVAVITKAVKSPLRWLTVLLGAYLLVTLVAHHVNIDLATVAISDTTVMQVLFVAVMTWLCLRVVRAVREYHIASNKRTDGGYDDFSAVQAVAVLAQIGIYLVAGLAMLIALDIPLTALAGLSVVGGFGAYGLTMANQTLVANIFSGLVLYFDRPFGVGDWISTKDGQIDGTVTKIGLRLTTVVGFDQRPIYVPNSIFNTTATVNPSRMNNRRIYQFIGLRYDDLHRVEQIKKVVADYLSQHDEIDKKRTTLVNLVNGSTNMGSSTEGCFGSSSINLMIYTFTKTTNWVRFQNIQDEIMMEISRLIEAAGAEIAFTTATLHIPDGLTVLPPPPGGAPKATEHTQS